MEQQDLADLLMYCGSQSDKVIQALNEHSMLNITFVAAASIVSLVSLLSLAISVDNYREVRRQLRIRDTGVDRRETFFETLRRS